MALTFDVCQLRPGSASFRKETTTALEKVVKTFQTTWEVIASGISDPSGVDEILAGNATGLPSVNNSVYSDPVSGQLYPYFFCTNKSVRRDPSNAYRFEVTCDYKDDSGDENPQDEQTDAENYCPVVSFSSAEQTQTAWSGSTNGSTRAITLPTGDFYDQAVLEKAGVLTVTHTQYENVFSEADFRVRIMHVNSAVYRGYDPGHALITGISWSKVRVPIAPNTTMLSNKVTYSIACVNKTYQYMDNGGLVQTDDWGWHQLRIRSGDRFLLNGGDMDSIVSNSSKFPDSIGPCFLKEDGTRHVKQGKEAPAAPIDKWQVQPNTNFGTFLRECP